MRKPKPWFRRSTRSWYVQIDGVQVPLGRNKEEAQQKYHQLMAGRPNGQTVGRVDALLDEFLEYVRHNQAEGTYSFYRHYLRSFNATVPDRRVHNLRPCDVQRWVDSQGWNPSTRNGAIRAVKRAFNWAVQQGLISASPIASLKRPRARSREVLVSPEQWQQIMAAADESLRDLLTILHETGCRPEEARIVEARHLRGDHYILSKKDSKGEVYNRIVWLTPAAQTILSRLAQEHPTGPLLRNRRGHPWTGGGLSKACNRLAKRVGFEFIAYACRHSWITSALENGVDAVSAALLAGHRDPSMVAKVYAHLSGNAEHMRKSLRKAKGAEGTGPAS